MAMGRNREAFFAGAEPFYGRQGGNIDEAPAGAGPAWSRWDRPTEPPRRRGQP